MVTNVTSLTRSGLADWVVQRVSAVIMALYMLCVLGFFFANPEMDAGKLRAYFGATSMQIFSTLTLFATAAHAWIGMWTIGTDYLLPAHIGASATAVRFLYQSACLLAIFLYVAWGLRIFWSL